MTKREILRSRDLHLLKNQALITSEGERGPKEGKGHTVPSEKTKRKKKKARFHSQKGGIISKSGAKKEPKKKGDPTEVNGGKSKVRKKSTRRSITRELMQKWGNALWEKRGEKREEGGIKT